MTLLSAARAQAPYVLTESGLLVPAGFADRDAYGGGGGAGSLVGFDWLYAGGSPQSLTIPTDTASGDLILVVRGGRSGDTYTPPGGAGYTNLWTHNDDGNAIHEMWYRYAGAGEGDTTEDWAYSGLGRGLELAMLVFTGVVSSGAPEDVASAKNNLYDPVPICPSVTTATDGALIIASYGSRCNDSASQTDDVGYPSGFTGVLRKFDGGDGFGIAYKFAGSAGATGTFTWATETAGETNLHINKTTAIKAS